MKTRTRSAQRDDVRCQFGEAPINPRDRPDQPRGASGTILILPPGELLIARANRVVKFLGVCWQNCGLVKLRRVFSDT